MPREPEPLQLRTPTLTSSLEIGSCYDGSDAETGFGVEIGTDLAFPGPGQLPRARTERARPGAARAQRLSGTGRVRHVA